MPSESEPNMPPSTSNLARNQSRTQWLRVSGFGFPSAFGFRPSDFGASLAFAFVLFACAFAVPVLAQPLSPHIGYVYPAGGRQGAVFQVAVGGQYLNSATNAYVSGTGVQAVVVDYSRPLTQKEFNDLRMKLQGLQEKRAAATRRGRGAQAGSQSGTNAVWTAADERTMAEMRQKLFLFAPRRNANPAIGETVTV